MKLTINALVFYTNHPKAEGVSPSILYQLASIYSSLSTTVMWTKPALFYSLGSRPELLVRIPVVRLANTTSRTSSTCMHPCLGRCPCNAADCGCDTSSWSFRKTRNDACTSIQQTPVPSCRHITMQCTRSREAVLFQNGQSTVAAR